MCSVGLGISQIDVYGVSKSTNLMNMFFFFSVTLASSFLCDFILSDLCGHQTSSGSCRIVCGWSIAGNISQGGVFMYKPAWGLQFVVTRVINLVINLVELW